MTRSPLRAARLDPAELIEPRGEGGRELSRHVLDDDEAGGGARQAGEHVFECLGAAGRGADRDHALGHARDRRRRALGQHGVGGEFLGRCHHRLGARAGRDVIHACMAGGLDGIAEQGLGVFRELAQPYLGLGDDVDRPGAHRLHGDLGALLGQGRADDDRRRPLGHEPAQEGQAIHARHLDVEHDDVGPLLLHQLARKQRVARRAHDLDAGDARELFGEYLPHHRRVVHDQDLHRHLGTIRSIAFVRR
ncbi:hypothetical protein Atep_16790 [Allochromatium tepidum]|uniref:Uncharacterized protein n=1 Tax=Allochromatium tepidum TaxID=553982 RepID=A0ABM7QMH9_9GAMM|nr:hypothetical protein Atep_16790 [Allochromatium tepidum]